MVVWDTSYAVDTAGSMAIVPLDQNGGYYPFASQPACLYTGQTFPSCIYLITVTGGSMVLGTPTWTQYQNGPNGMIVYPITFQGLVVYSIAISVKTSSGTAGSGVASSPYAMDLTAASNSFASFDSAYYVNSVVYLSIIPVNKYGGYYPSAAPPACVVS